MVGYTIYGTMLPFSSTVFRDCFISSLNYFNNLSLISLIVFLSFAFWAFSSYFHHFTRCLFGSVTSLIQSACSSFFNFPASSLPLLSFLFFLFQMSRHGGNWQSEWLQAASVFHSGHRSENNFKITHGHNVLS